MLKSTITRRQFLKRVGLAGAVGLVMITDSLGLEPSEESTPKNNSKICEYKAFCGDAPSYDLKGAPDIRVLAGDSCDLSKGYESCQRYLENKSRLHRYTVLAVTDLIIGSYGETK